MLILKETINKGRKQHRKVNTKLVNRSCSSTLSTPNTGLIKVRFNKYIKGKAIQWKMQNLFFSISETVHQKLNIFNYSKNH